MDGMRCSAEPLYSGLRVSHPSSNSLRKFIIIAIWNHQYTSSKIGFIDILYIVVFLRFCLNVNEFGYKDNHHFVLNESSIVTSYLTKFCC